MVCIRSYHKSVLRYTFLSLGTYLPDTLYLRQRGCEDPWLFFEAKRGHRAKILDNTAVRKWSLFDLRILRNFKIITFNSFA